MKRILVPCDFSNHGYLAALLAARIAKKAGGQIALFHAIEPFEHQAISKRLAEHRLREMTGTSARLLSDLKGRLDEEVGDVDIHMVVRSAQPTEGILAFASEWRADGIAMGTAGIGEPLPHQFGSVALRVARDANVPVLLVRNQHANKLPADGWFKRPMIAIDYGRFAEPAVAAAQALTAPGNILELVHVYYAPDLGGRRELKDALAAARTAELQRLEAYAGRIDDIPLSVSVLSDGGHIAAQILDYVRKSNTDLLVLGAHGRDLSIAILGTSADRMIRYATVPILVLPDGVLRKGRK
jgi:nucleotide-binding universal stress UspA family protein